ncbi:phage tail protein [Flavilitoribacter nigricans]|uniref:Phage tail protein n=1 Tax=Flavilitoribacter nigricans (strain ATCC 23147 / DSM 23189 / NBRC 102662 / NCIMB 1420 / SS-2) TaxID=1122177 RepID=A0A2D0NEV3_FLAN2|nr:tail fiber protein [Flavilitoribacter nigricans]PHN06709.1 phage tail protein [Flavilitoribacter nigricans DSM 23189 = NBRC 102662]
MQPFIGQIQAFGFNFAPQGWSLCDGQLLAINSNQALFSLLGTTFGGDGRTTFGLPDLRGRSIVHVGNGPGLSQINWGQKAGAETHTLTLGQMPSHNHVATVHLGTGLANNANGSGANFAANTGGTSIYNSGALGDAMALGNVTVNNNGSNQAFNMRNPYLGIYVGIALFGIFPSRN